MMPDTESPLVTVIVPTVNEVDNIDPLLTRLTDVFRSSGDAFEILIADGGSTDGPRCDHSSVFSRADSVRRRQ